MKQLSKSVYAEFYGWGCNPGFIVTSEGVFLVDTPQQPVDAVRWREMITDRFGPIRYLVNTEPHGDHTSGNAYFPGVEVIGHPDIAARYREGIAAMSSPERLERMKQTDPDSVWLVNHPAYPPNPPTRLYTDKLDVPLGNHTIQIINFPGHTKPQTHVYLQEERVMFTGDNIFHKCKIFVQECDPWELLETMKRMETYEAVFAPGHGEPCDKSYLKEQAAIVEGWIGYVEGLVKRGMSEEEAAKQPVPKIDPYAPAQRLFEMEARINEMNVRNLYKKIAARQGAR